MLPGLTPASATSTSDRSISSANESCDGFIASACSPATSRGDLRTPGIRTNLIRRVSGELCVSRRMLQITARRSRCPQHVECPVRVCVLHQTSAASRSRAVAGSRHRARGGQSSISALGGPPNSVQPQTTCEFSPGTRGGYSHGISDRSVRTDTHDFNTQGFRVSMIIRRWVPELSP